ncbi:hypothetical protein [Pseudoalteromonas piscicida]|uniref:hypothetical protein n=1 Tax=Pseudoalteromonas piscicida TaxID=43662 RepID=UPI001CB7AFD4|nr:hypothetical protein [Pseudoalteromonas piscicida]
MYTYFPHHMWLDEGQEPSEFQRYFMNWFPEALKLTNGWKNWFVAPRGEGKSTLGVKISPVYVAVLALLQEDDVCKELDLPKPSLFIDYAILFGAEAKMPAKTLEVVKTELLQNNNLLLDFPEVCQTSPTWKIGEFVTAQGVRFESRGLSSLFVVHSTALAAPNYSWPMTLSRIKKPAQPLSEIHVGDF